MSDPLCFVLMPFGEHAQANELGINFEAIYRDVVARAIREAKMVPVRADEAMIANLSGKAVLEQFMLSDYAVADMTIITASTLYRLGLRDALRPGTTVFIGAKGSRSLADVSAFAPITYSLTPEGLPKDVQDMQANLAKRLKEVRYAVVKSSVYHFVENYMDIGHTKTDVFREKADYSEQKKAELAHAREKGVEALRAIETQLGPIESCESGVVIDLLLSYRAVTAWKEMIDLVKKMSSPLASSVMVQEQLGFALNRMGKSEQAEQLLKELISKRGPSSETHSILGRVYKDRWEDALKRGDKLAQSLLREAIEAYLSGFEADWRDAFPGINAITLMEISEPPDARRKRLLPVVSYAVERRIASGKSDYWDHASRVELAVLSKNKRKALLYLNDALSAVRESWEPETTARNLKLIREAREGRNEIVAWTRGVEEALEQRSLKLSQDNS